jgi:Na+/H+-dicarboxylate symporter
MANTQSLVLPLIICAMVIAVQKLSSLDDGTGGRLAKWTVTYYIVTTLLAIVISCILTSLVWQPMFDIIPRDQIPDSSDSADERVEAGSENPPHMVVKQMFQSFIPKNVVSALANNELLAVLVTAVVIGYLIPSSDSYLLKIIYEIETMIMRIITFLIKLAPIGVFFLILPNLMKLPLTEIGKNLGLLIGGTLSSMAIHLALILPALFFGFTRMNPYPYWFKCSPAWITAWGSASSAATLPVTLRMCAARGIPVTVYKFAAPLGCLINMDG